MNIFEYIKNNEVLSDLPFIAVYATIVELINDGFVLQNVD